MKSPISFGKYVLLERVNVGGMAEVFKAKAFGVEGFERLVALKRILPSIAEDQEFITMFIDEAKIAVQLTHANIAQIFDLGKVGDSYFIAMELVHGKDLRAIFDRARKRGETIPVPMACFTAMKVCEGLDYAHNKKDAAGRDLNLVHRDVSPQNILLSYDGESKIIDFGIAKAAGKASKTQAGILKGKFGYMSPEQVRGLPLDRRSDVFAVGIVLYELLTGERLFVGESDFSTLEKVRNVEIMPPSTYNRRIPEELEQIVLKALAKDVDDRYQTAMDLHDDLQSFMYTSGNFFSRKDLSTYLRKAFAEEIARESQREEEYRRMEAEAARTGGSGSGLDAFADLAPAPARAANVAAVTARPPAPPKRTLMGVGLVPPPPSRSTSGAPPPPPGASRPPSEASAPPPPSKPPVAPMMSAPAVSSPPVSSPAVSSPAVSSPPVSSPAVPGAALDMDWDDEELSTQLYDKPEDLLLPSVPEVEPQFSAPAPYTASAAPPGPVSSFSKASSPGLVPGAPSPFDDLPAPTDPSDRPIGPEPTALTRTEVKRSGGKGLPVVLGIAAALLIAIAVGVGYFFLRSQPGTIQLTTDPPDAVVYLDDQPVTTSTSSPFVIANVQPGEHIVEVRKRGYQRWATPVTLGSGQTLQLPPVRLEPESAAPAAAPAVVTAPPTPSSGDLPSIAAPPSGATGFRLETVPPGAAVFIGDQRRAETTPIAVTDLAPGTYTIRAELANYAPWTTQLDISANQVVSVPRAMLMLRQVTLRLESEPSGARVVLVRGTERRTVGETPTTTAIELAGGAWTVEMARAGHETWSQPLSLANDQAEQTLRATLRERERTTPSNRPTTPRPQPPTSAEPRAQPPSGSDSRPQPQPQAAASGAPGTLRVNSTPWSQVYVDGRLIGNTPQMNISLPPGRHTVTFVNPDFNIREQVPVTIRAGETETVIRRLNVPGGG